MKCLIIAAGQGNRLSQTGVHKPFIPIWGLRLIERTILTAWKAGIDEFYVVTGYQAAKLEEFLWQLGRGKNIKMHFIRNDEWESKENGVSVLKAKSFLKERFILLMADHIFEEATLRELLEEPAGDAELVLAVDFKIGENKFIDVNDVTKVRVKERSIVDIGKNLTEYNAYDTGMFLCSPAFFQAIEESSLDGDSSLSGAVRALAEKGKAVVLNIKGHYWMDVDTPQDIRNAKKMLLRTLTKVNDGWISRKINRKFSTRLFTPLILKLYAKISPNIVSVLSAAVGVLAGLFFFFQKAVPGGILVQLASILDGCDGEIARLKKMSSPFGNFFDALLDRYTDSIILFGMFYYSLSSGNIARLLGGLTLPFVLLVSILAITGNLMVSYTSAKSLADFGYRYRGRWLAAGRGRDLRLFLLFIGGLTASLHPVSVLAALTIVALISNAIVVKRVFLSRSYSFKKDRLIKSRISAVIFDFDGTLADTMTFLTGVAARLLADNYDVSEQEARRRYLETSGLDFASQMELMFPNHPKNRRVIAAFEKRKHEGVLDHPLFPEVIPALTFFQDKKISRFICSSTPQEILDEYWQSNNIDSRAAGLVEGYFGLKQDLNKSRQIDVILDRYALRSEEVLFVGDSLKDGEVARSKNIEFVGLTRIFSEDQFSQRGFLCAKDLAALTRLWDQSERYLDRLEIIKS